MSRPAPKFKVGQLVRIVGCLNHPEVNGTITPIIDGPRWRATHPVALPDGRAVVAPAGWVYRIARGPKSGWAHECRLRFLAGTDPLVTWDEIEIDTGWRPEVIHA